MGEGYYDCGDNSCNGYNSAEMATAARDCYPDCTTEDIVCNSCFPAGTEVEMSAQGGSAPTYAGRPGGRERTTKNIEDIQIGDRVISQDEDGNKIVSTVKELKTPISTNMCEITFADGDTLKLTDNHTMSTVEGWKAINPEAARAEIPSLTIGQLEEGDEIIQFDSSAQGGSASGGRGSSEVQSYACWSERQQTYNLVLEGGVNTYFADGYLAHNKGEFVCGDENNGCHMPCCFDDAVNRCVCPCAKPTGLEVVSQSGTQAVLQWDTRNRDVFTGISQSGVNGEIEIEFDDPKAAVTNWFELSTNKTWAKWNNDVWKHELGPTVEVTSGSITFSGVRAGDQYVLYKEPITKSKIPPQPDYGNVDASDLIHVYYDAIKWAGSTSGVVSVGFDNNGINLDPGVSDWIGIYSSGDAGDGEWLDWKYLNNSQSLPGGVVSSGTVEFGPYQMGEYELRYGAPANDGVVEWEDVEVGGWGVLGSASVVDGRVSVSFVNNDAHTNDWIGIAYPDNWHNQGGDVFDWKYLNNTQGMPGEPVVNGTVTFDSVIEKTGIYSVQYYRDGVYYKIDEVEANVPNEILNGVEVDEEARTVTVGFVNGSSQTNDWIGIYHSGWESYDLGDYSDWRWLNNSQTQPASPVVAGTVSFAIDDLLWLSSYPGEYHVKYVRNGDVIETMSLPSELASVETVGSVWPEKYNLYVDDDLVNIQSGCIDQDNPCLVKEENLPRSTNRWTVDGLTPGVTYHWRVNYVAWEGNSRLTCNTSSYSSLETDDGGIVGTVYYDPDNTCSTATPTGLDGNLRVVVRDTEYSANVPSAGEGIGQYSLSAPVGTHDYVDLENIMSGFGCSTGCLQSCPTATSVSAPSVGNNFFLTDNAEAWWQVVGAGVYAGSSEGGVTIDSALPRVSTRLVIPGTNDLAAIVRASGNVSTGQGEISDENWSVVSPYKGKIMDYRYFANRMGVTPGTESDFSGGMIEELEISGQMKDLYYAEDIGDNEVSLGSEWDVTSGESYVIFVDGDLRINQDVMVDPGGFLAFIVNGGVTVSADVVNMQGIYVMDNTFTTETLDPTDDSQLVVEGMVVAWDGVKLNRALDGASNGSTPAEQFMYRPDLLVNMPPKMKSFAFNWQEVVPGTFD